jgi:NTP pyrophosphatase (non-canonical NTP hydrolase)
MKFNEYQEKAKEMAIYPAQGTNFSYPALGLVGEAGEVAEKVKKIIRDQDGVITKFNQVEIAKELGDVLWYIAILADEMGVTLDKVAEGNLEKLNSRKKRGVLSGSGDNR